MVLAGGEGKRLLPLTLIRAKPAVPFGGHYRLIDFPLSNLANGGYRRIVVLTQYKSHSLDVHLSKTWRMSTLLGNYVTSVPAQMRRGPRWFLGSADAIFQNMNLIDDEKPDYVFVFGADHIYRIDPRQMLDQHIASGAGITVAGIRVAKHEADQFGIISAGPDGRINEFLEKPNPDDIDGLDDLTDLGDLDDLAARVDPRSYRLLVLRSHYRTPVEITEATTGEAATSLARLDGLLRRCGSLDGVTPDPVLLDVERRYGLVYYELTRHYRVRSLDDGTGRNYRSLGTALDGLGRFAGIALGGLETSAPGGPGERGTTGAPPLVARLALRLDGRALPLPLQSPFGSAWRLASASHVWTLPPTPGTAS